MGKITSLYGKTTGKIGSIVFSTSGGETIAREYNPHVANPNTAAQVNQRAKMKLMSQVSQVLAPILTFRKDGLVSARNQFVKTNFNWATASNGIAQVSYENLQITNSSRGLGQVIVMTDASAPAIGIATRPAADIKSVVYALYGKNSESGLDYIGSFVVSQEIYDDGYEDLYYQLFLDDELYPGLHDTYMSYDEVLVYAYGITENAETARAKYGDVKFQTALDIAQLIGTRTIDFKQTQLTQTRGTTLYPNGSVAPPTPAGSYRVFVTASPSVGGSVSGGGTFESGTSVTVVATAASGYHFVKWKYNGTELTASATASYTFNVNSQTDLVAVFESDGNESL